MNVSELDCPVGFFRNENGSKPFDHTGYSWSNSSKVVGIMRDGGLLTEPHNQLDWTINIEDQEDLVWDIIFWSPDCEKYEDMTLDQILNQPRPESEIIKIPKVEIVKVSSDAENFDFVTDSNKQDFAKVSYYKDVNGDDTLDRFEKVHSTERMRGGYLVLMQKYIDRYDLKDTALSEAIKISNYAQRLVSFERSLIKDDKK